MLFKSKRGGAPGGRALPAIAASVRDWRYTGDKRDLRLDLLRGFAAITMVIDHIGGKDSWLYTVSGGDRFFTSAAEGFVFISGLVMGIVYASLIARKGIRAALTKGAKRVATLYSLAVGLAFVFAGISSYLGLPWSPELSFDNLFSFIGGILTLHRTFYLTDVMVLYTLVIALALPLLVLMWRGYGWLALMASWALWAAWQFWPGDFQIPWAISGNAFSFPAWQALFITGLVLGYHRAGIERRIGSVLNGRRWTAAQFAGLALSGALVAGAIVVFFWNMTHPGNILVAPHIADLFGKPDLRIGRLAVFAAIFVFAYLAVTLAWKPIKRITGWLLLPLGQQALTVYSMHLFMIVLLTEAAPWLLGRSLTSKMDYTVVQVAGIALIWLMIMAIPGAKVLARRAANKSAEVLQSATRRTQPANPTKPAGARLDAISAGRRQGEARRVGLGFAGLLAASIVLTSAAPVLAATFKGSAARNQSTALKQASSAEIEIPGAMPTGVAVPDDDIAMPTGAVLPNSAFSAGTTTSATPSPTPQAKVDLPSYVEEHTFMSASLNRVMPYYIYFPPDYASHPDTHYPVLYMLHGISGTFNEWFAYGLPGKANDMMKVGQISQFIIVMPQGDQGYWVDHANGGPQWGTYVVRDLVSEIDSHYRTIADAEHRAIGGLSMGGQAALQMAINYPDVFSIVGAHSPSLHNHATAPSFFGDQDYFNAHDPVYLFSAHPNIARTLKIWLDDGQDDGWLPSITSFQQSLQANGIQDEWHVYPGLHDGVYWSSHIPDYLNFYSKALSSAPAITPTVAPTATTTSVPAAPPADTSPTPGMQIAH